jgi:hypothetical protein
MNLPIAVFGLYLALCLGLYVYYRRGLFFVYPITLIILPTLRLNLGFPLYLFDVSGGLILAAAVQAGGWRAWPRGVLPWHFIFAGFLVFAGIIVPMFRYGFSLQSVWISGHASLSFMQIFTAAALVNVPSLAPSRKFLIWGIVAGLAALGIVLWLQFGSPGMSRAINGFFYRDQATSFNMTEFGAAITAQRSAGPFFNPNSAGVVAVLAAYVAWLLGSRKMTFAAFALAAACVIPTVSRQAMLALALALSVSLIAGDPKRRIVGIALLALVPLVAPLATMIPALAPAFERFGRWQGGALEDNNVSGRLIDGPIRLWNLIVEKPDTAVVGAGWDVIKLMNQGLDVGIYSTGFVSNSFLLWLYYGGIGGFILILVFFGQMLRASIQSRGLLKAKAVAITVAIMFLYFSDNGGILIEAYIAPISIAAGLIFAFQVRQEALARQMQRRPPGVLPVESWIPEASPAARLER